MNGKFYKSRGSILPITMICVYRDTPTKTRQVTCKYSNLSEANDIYLKIRKYENKNRVISVTVIKDEKVVFRWEKDKNTGT